MNQPAPSPDIVVAPAPAGDEPRCPNCREPLLGEFCYGCGQPKKGFIRHLSGIIGDFFDTVFNIDSRTLRTVVPLFFRPGFLSIEYFEGRRVRYVTPLRLYFFFSVLAFLAVSWVTHVEKSKDGSGGWYEDDSDGKGGDPVEVERQRAEALKGLETGRPYMGDAAYNEAAKAINDRFDKEMQKAVEQTVKQFTPKPPKRPAKPAPTTAVAGEPSATAAPPAPAKPAPPPVTDKAGGRKDEDDDNDEDNVNVNFGNGSSWDPEKEPIDVSWLNDASNAWLTQQARRMVSNAKHIDDDPNRFLAQVFSQAPQVLFVILPLFALMLKCFYLFKRRLYMEHLIVALHSHSFLCLSILLLAGISALTTQATAGTLWVTFLGLAKFLILWWIPIHLLIAQKRIYRQGWLMTLFKFCLIGFAYTVMISFGIVVNMMVSLASL